MRLRRLAPAVTAGLLMLPYFPAGPFPSAAHSGAGEVRAADPAPADDRVKEVVDGRVAEWWPKPEEKRFDRIGWAADIRAALRLAAEHDRPVFLFTMDGRVNLGRC